jgi:hypothetical protein
MSESYISLGEKKRRLIIRFMVCAVYVYNVELQAYLYLSLSLNFAISIEISGLKKYKHEYSIYQLNYCRALKNN